MHGTGEKLRASIFMPTSPNPEKAIPVKKIKFTRAHGFQFWNADAPDDGLASVSSRCGGPVAGYNCKAAGDPWIRRDGGSADGPTCS